MQESQRVYIILINYNAWEDTIECVESLLNLDYPDFRIVIVENCSPNDSMEHLLAWANGDILPFIASDNTLKRLSFPPTNNTKSFVVYNEKTSASGGDKNNDSKIIFIKADRNGGFASGNNIGAKYGMARNDAAFFWFLNNDTVVETSTLSSLVNFSRTRPTNKRTGIVGSRMFYYHQPHLLQGVGGRYHKRTATTSHVCEGQPWSEGLAADKIDYAIGASMMISRDFYQEVGPMNEDLFLYYEEIDWTLRGQALNFEACFCPHATVFHKEGATIGQGNKKKFANLVQDYYGLRGRLVITKKFFPGSLPTVYLAIFFSLLNGIRRGQFSRIKVVGALLLHGTRIPGWIKR